MKNKLFTNKFQNKKKLEIIMPLNTLLNTNPSLELKQSLNIKPKLELNKSHNKKLNTSLKLELNTFHNILPNMLPKKKSNIFQSQNNLKKLITNQFKEVS